MIQDGSPTTEREIVDPRTLQHAKLDPIPNTAADFRNWKSTLILLLGQLDISGSDYLTSWVSQAFKVNTAELCASSSELVPRLDRWLASELTKGLTGVSWLAIQGAGFTLSVVHVMGPLHAVVQCFTWSLVTLTWIATVGR